ncbi:MAG: UDP-N-acetylmuramoyl-tripeptide--D-alanyl-D-alanine ligase [Myxococcota bacterium]|nr:UDP-N-acetylmuramoyl-tripeptide--D-alanyl-D-alanine ligase [Myxococcota bacterium]MDW8362534.1 UDP-N-acetylmuramoyl-tripeptide--D-alanyl-D-alanine ligase [Myxococcales bacterium]
MSTPLPVNEASFELDELVAHTGGRLVRRGAAKARGICTDSRSLRPGNAFVALVGTRHDGHDFLERATQSGAAALVVRDAARAPHDPSVAVVEVADTLEALGALGRAWRRQWGGRVVCVAGSAGKTTTKELVAAGLRAAGLRVHAAPGNLNNRVGVPLVLLGLAPQHELAVLELGTNRRGEIAALSAIAEPDVGVLTLVDVEHAEGLGTLEDIAREEGALLDALGPAAVAVVNADDAHVEAAAARSRAGRLLRFGTRAGAQVRLLGWELTEEPGTRARFEIDGEPLDVVLSLLGPGAALDAGAALGVALALGVDRARFVEGLSALRPVPGRLRPVRGPDGCLVLDDTYNASPRSLRAALETARALADRTRRRLFVVLGDMLELGPFEREAHEEAGRRVAEVGAEFFVAVGPRMRAAADVAHAAGVQASARPDWAATLEVLRGRLAPDVLLLVKASRSVGLDALVASLEAGGAS